ncbi:Holliday junction resolvase RecU [Mycoplasmopsis lipophila]|uniref:Holliday junction resolvase RecU n=1 Tax=Mycoplasmopsis lipophila TaxID=2117 RepID=UPI003872CDA1
MINKNKGMLLESIINKTINYYSENKIAYIEKKNLNINFKRLFVNQNNIISVKDGIVSSKSTVDYIGCYQGKFIAFEAKSTNEKVLPSSNVQIHQIDYLKKIADNGGIAFFIIFFGLYNDFFIVDIYDYINRNKKPLAYEEVLKIGKKIELEYPGLIDFLPHLNK